MPQAGRYLLELTEDQAAAIACQWAGHLAVKRGDVDDCLKVAETFRLALDNMGPKGQDELSGLLAYHLNAYRKDRIG